MKYNDSNRKYCIEIVRQLRIKKADFGMQISIFVSVNLSLIRHSLLAIRANNITDFIHKTKEALDILFDLIDLLAEKETDTYIQCCRFNFCLVKRFLRNHTESQSHLQKKIYTSVNYSTLGKQCSP